jgi:hypothetical protein
MIAMKQKKKGEKSIENANFEFGIPFKEPIVKKRKMSFSKKLSQK